MNLSNQPSIGTHALARPGGSIAFDVAGSGAPVVCVPGMGELRSSFRHTVPELVHAGHQVATMDLRGHGDSDATFDSYDDAAAAGDILALIERLDSGPAVIVGSSMGAAAAVLAAAMDPEAVAGLVLVGPFVRNPPTSRVMVLLFRALMAGPWRAAAWTAYLPALSPGTRAPDFDEHRREIRDSLRRPGHSRAFGRTTRSSHAAAEARLGLVGAPTLVVMGQADPDFSDPAAEARWVCDALSGTELLVPGAGHYPHADRPDIVNPELIAFLRRVTAVA
jgi:pimeloyl-ACP methyl ester carboxylesterase